MASGTFVGFFIWCAWICITVAYKYMFIPERLHWRYQFDYKAIALGLIILVGLSAGIGYFI